eukprot:g524.t1
MGCNKELLLVVAFGIIAFALADTCLVDAIPEDQRKYLVNDGESYPLGLWINGWPAGFVTAHVVWILLEETWARWVISAGPQCICPPASKKPPTEMKVGSWNFIEAITSLGPIRPSTLIHLS